MTKDRRSALSEYATVKQALRDRERIATAKAKKGAAKNTTKKAKKG